MPLTPLVKNKGPLLISKDRGGIDDFPREFVSKIGTDTYVQEVPVDVEIDDLTDFLLSSKLVQERTNERKRINTYFGGFGPNGDSDLTIDDILGISLVSELVLPDGQIGTRTRTLVREGSHLTADELTVDGQQRNLGNGWMDQVYTVKPTVFHNKTSSVEITDLVPEVFRVLLPTYTTEETLVGTIVDPPVLGVGELSKTENQIDLFTKRVSLRSRFAVPTPLAITVLRHTGAEQYGGAVTKLVGFFDSSEPAVDTGLLIVSSEVKNLGNGTFFRQTESLNTGTAWPILSSRLWDEVMQVEYDETRQVVAAGTAESPNPGVFGWRSEVRAIDQWKSIRVNTSKNAPAYVDAASALVSYEMKPFKFPGFIPSGYSPSMWNVRQASARIVQHKIKTWWINSTNPPPTPAYDEIITDTAPVSNFENTGWVSINDVLHDAYSIGSAFYPATTPSGFQYCGQFLITGTCDFTAGSTLVSGTGTSFTTELAVGDSLGGFPISSITNNTTLHIATPFPYPTMTGATVVATRTSGTWIGTLRVIGASVTPEKEPNVWKVQTESVIMR